MGNQRNQHFSNRFHRMVTKVLNNVLSFVFQIDHYCVMPNETSLFSYGPSAVYNWNWELYVIHSSSTKF